MRNHRLFILLEGLHLGLYQMHEPDCLVTLNKTNLPLAIVIHTVTIWTLETERCMQFNNVLNERL